MSLPLRKYTKRIPSALRKSLCLEEITPGYFPRLRNAAANGHLSLAKYILNVCALSGVGSIMEARHMPFNRKILLWIWNRGLARESAWTTFAYLYGCTLTTSDIADNMDRLEIETAIRFRHIDTVVSYVRLVTENPTHVFDVITRAGDAELINAVYFGLEP